MVTASEIFEFIDRTRAIVIDRHELEMPEFSMLRFGMRRMIVLLQESDEHQYAEVSDVLRMSLSSWLTVPILFDEGLLRILTSTLGDQDAVSRLWGRDFGEAYSKAISGARALQGKANPVRTVLEQVVHEALSSKVRFRVLCHKAAIDNFPPMIPRDAFFHSAAGYRKAAPFDLLIKVGPLRSRGWGAAPDAILAAPRYGSLCQIVWNGCVDEDGFGYDVTSAIAGVFRGGVHVNAIDISSRIHRQRVGDNSLTRPDMADEDEFEIFQKLRDPREFRQASLVQLENEGVGALYPPNARVISFDPNPASPQPLLRRIVNDDLGDQMFLVRPSLASTMMSEVHAEYGRYSRVWKSRLRAIFLTDQEGLCGRFREAGLDLENLPHAIRHWIKAPTTVIHAPQQKRHFEAMIRVLGVDDGNQVGPITSRSSWWKAAWREIAESRSVAIQAGVRDHDEVEEALLAALNENISIIRDRAAESPDGFVVELGESEDLQGALLFDRISAIEAGFRAPAAELRQIRDIGYFEQWRE
jgi:hypothetical protein